MSETKNFVRIKSVMEENIKHGKDRYCGLALWECVEYDLKFLKDGQRLVIEREKEMLRYHCEDVKA